MLVWMLREQVINEPIFEFAIYEKFTDPKMQLFRSVLKKMVKSISAGQKQAYRLPLKIQTSLA